MVPAKYRGADATLSYIVDVTDRVRIADEVREKTQQIARNFETTIGGLVQSLASTAIEMRTTSHGMSTTAEDTTAQATKVLAAVEEASGNAQIVAAATEELSSSVSEIGRQVTQSTQIAGQAVQDANRTNMTVQGLSAAAQKIGDVVKLISDIASQTNLLALNATIEAARAGEAGRGLRWWQARSSRSPARPERRPKIFRRKSPRCSRPPARSSMPSRTSAERSAQ